MPVIWAAYVIFIARCQWRIQKSLMGMESGESPSRVQRQSPGGSEGEAPKKPTRVYKISSAKIRKFEMIFGHVSFWRHKIR